MIRYLTECDLIERTMDESTLDHSKKKTELTEHYDTMANTAGNTGPAIA